MKLEQALLWPLSVPYGAVVHLRARAYEAGLLRQRQINGIVISVGNLTVGGTGKTPMVMWIAERLLAEGKRVGILTRGYRGAGHEDRTATGDASGESSSDEVRLMKARLGSGVAFGVGPNRFDKGQELAKRGVEWFVLDDGFQHLQLARRVDIVLIDATNPFGGGRLLPAGRLRERRTSLSRADVIVITRSDHAPAIEAAVRRDTDAPIFYATVRPLGVRVLRDGYPGREDLGAKASKLLAFCGIGNPDGFISDLRKWGLDIVSTKFFPDHHRYRREDIDELEEKARTAGAAGLICTEKDVFNLGDNQPRSLEICYCPISMQVGNDEEFWRTLKAKADSRKRLRA